jgi:hypothetical protein
VNKIILVNNICELKKLPSLEGNANVANKDVPNHNPVNATELKANI